jgi:hypothetical protein
MNANENDRPGGRIRIGDEERDDAVRRLGEHYEAGRLTAEEHTERVGEALQAKTQEDLAGLFADLPGEGRRPGPAEETGQAGPWGWGSGAPRAARGESSGPSGRGPWAAGGPPWARSGRGPGGLPLPLLAALVVAGVLLSIACTVGGGHPPVLPLLLIIAGIAFVRRSRRGRRA